MTVIRFWIDQREYECPEKWFVEQRRIREKLGANPQDAVTESLLYWGNHAREKLIREA